MKSTDIRSLPSIHSRQRGAILVISLILLLVLTVLGVAAMQMTRMEERMAGNSRDVNLAFQGAEAGLRDAEERIRLMTSRPSTCAAAPCGIWQQDYLMAVDMRNAAESWWVANGQEYGTAGTQEVTDVTRDPVTVTEDLGFIPDSLTVGHGPPEGRNFYKVTASSTGASANTTAVLESTYTRRF